MRHLAGLAFFAGVVCAAPVTFTTQDVAAITIAPNITMRFAGTTTTYNTLFPRMESFGQLIVTAPLDAINIYDKPWAFDVPITVNGVVETAGIAGTFTIDGSQEIRLSALNMPFNPDPLGIGYSYKNFAQLRTTTFATNVFIGTPEPATYLTVSAGLLLIGLTRIKPQHTQALPPWNLRTETRSRSDQAL